MDAVGADPADTRARAELLRAGGARVTALAAGPGLDPESAKPARGLHVTASGAAAVEAIRSRVADVRPDLALVASAERGGGELARALPASVPALWWPTGTECATSRGWFGMLARSLRGRVLPSMFGAELPWEGAVAGLAGSSLEGPRGRAPILPIWDGDIVLAPEGLDGPGGALVLSAFASVAEEWSELDLVTWSHPRDSVEAMARGLGAGARVHQVGPPPRMAERAWCSHARAVLLAGDVRLSGGLVLRALAMGCPLLCVGPAPGFAPLAEALASRGCATVVERSPPAVAEALALVLECGPEVKRAIALGRDLAATHDGSALGEWLVGGLGLPGLRRAAAA